jgi:hypothetical protein
MNYYKILNEEEYHHKLQYKFGLNIDPLKFNPYGDCTSGGIYFSREDILYFLDYGPYIRKVTLPEDAQIYENPGEPKKWKADKVILGERENITAEVIKRLIDEGADPIISDNYPLRWAARYGHTEIVKLLVSVTNPKIHNSYILRNAACHGHIEVVKLLLPLSNLEMNNIALKYATYNGHTEIVKLLIPVSDPKSYDNIALVWAVERGYTDIIKLLIPVSKISDELIKFCKKFCKDQEIRDLIISNKKE